MNEQRNLSNETDISTRTNISDKKHNLTRWTKYLLDFMFYGGMVVTASLDTQCSAQCS